MSLCKHPLNLWDHYFGALHRQPSPLCIFHCYVMTISTAISRSFRESLICLTQWVVQGLCKPFFYYNHLFFWWNILRCSFRRTFCKLASLGASVYNLIPGIMSTSGTLMRLRTGFRVYYDTDNTGSISHRCAKISKTFNREKARLVNWIGF